MSIQQFNRTTIIQYAEQSASLIGSAVIDFIRARPRDGDREISEVARKALLNENIQSLIVSEKILLEDINTMHKREMALIQRKDVTEWLRGEKMKYRRDIRGCVPPDAKKSKFVIATPKKNYIFTSIQGSVTKDRINPNQLANYHFYKMASFAMAHPNDEKIQESFRMTLQAFFPRTCAMVRDQMLFEVLLHAK